MTETVVIAGAGPVGLMLAAELALAGTPPVVLERRAGRESESYSRLLHGHSAALLAQRGLLDQLGELPRWPFVHFAHIPLDLGKADPRDYWLIVPQTRVEAVLEKRAVELGADIRWNTEVVGVAQDEEGVTVTVRTPGGVDEIRAAYLFWPSWYGVVGHVAGYEGPPGGTTGPGGMFGAIPDDGFHHLMTTEFDRPTPPPDVPVTFDELRASVRRVTGGDVTGGQPGWLARYGNVTRIASTYRIGRVLLAGDAAHVHFHAVGHGLNTGLNDAVNLGWKLAAQVAGWAPPGLLDSYDRERRPVGERAVQVMLAQLALLHPYGQVGPIRSLFAELTDIDEVVRRLVGAVTRVRYPIEAAGEGADSPLLGDRIDGLVLAEGRGALLDLSGGEADLTAAAGWSDRVDLVTDPDVTLPEVTASEASGASGAGGAEAAVPRPCARALLVRPDGHVAWVDTAGPGEPTDVKGLTAALTTWFG